MPQYSTRGPDITDDGELLPDSLEDSIEKDKEERDEDDALCDLYDKVGGYYNWSWIDFMNTPPHISYKLNAKLDKKIENLDNPDSIFSYGFLNVLLAIGKAFGGKK